MDIQFFKTFKTILEAGSFQNAANILDYTQSTISFHVQQLEQEYSIKLFEKIGRRMVLTQAGQDILPYIDNILLSEQQIMNYGKQAGELSGVLKVALPETLLVYKMQPVLKQFKQQAENVMLSLQSYNCYTIDNYILNGMLDLGIYYDVNDHKDSIITHPLNTFSLVLVCSSNAPAITSMSDLSEHSLIISDDKENVCRNHILKHLEAQNIQPANIIELPSFEAIKKSTINNLGITYMPRFVAQDALSDGSLIELHIGLPEDRVTTLCAYHKNKWLTPAMQLFMKLTSEYMHKAFD
ncbi:MAG: LysR family transcriptional regulator [Christensenellales bacterium]|jgi:DNA-binding transcriptional LysR family regulator